LFLSGL